MSAQTRQQINPMINILAVHKKKNSPNIYTQLGAVEIAFDERLPLDDIYVYGDGSTSDRTRFWALSKLGFQNTPEIEYISWQEAGDRSAIVPSRAVRRGFELILHAVSGQPGYVQAEYARIDRQILMTKKFPAGDINLVFDQAIELACLLLRQFKIKIFSPHTDSRCHWHEESGVETFGYWQKLYRVTVLGEEQDMFWTPEQYEALSNNKSSAI
jgi:hypothetical protein